MHAATLVTAGIYLLLRSSPILEYSPTALLILTFIGSTTAFVAATSGLVQNDLKRIVAFSTISQLGYFLKLYSFWANSLQSLWDFALGIAGKSSILYPFEEKWRLPIQAPAFLTLRVGACTDTQFFFKVLRASPFLLFILLIDQGYLSNIIQNFTVPTIAREYCFNEELLLSVIPVFTRKIPATAFSTLAREGMEATVLPKGESTTKIKDNFLKKATTASGLDDITRLKDKQVQPLAVRSLETSETFIKIKPNMEVLPANSTEEQCKDKSEYLDKYSDFSFSARVKIKDKYSKNSCIYL